MGIPATTAISLTRAALDLVLRVPGQTQLLTVRFLAKRFCRPWDSADAHETLTEQFTRRYLKAPCVTLSRPTRQCARGCRKGGNSQSTSTWQTSAGRARRLAGHKKISRHKSLGSPFAHGEVSEAVAWHARHTIRCDAETGYSGSVAGRICCSTTRSHVIFLVSF